MVLKNVFQSEKINTDFEDLLVLDTSANQFIKEHEILNLNSIGFITGPESGFSEAEREIMNRIQDCSHLK